MVIVHENVRYLTQIRQIDLNNDLLNKICHDATNGTLIINSKNQLILDYDSDIFDT